MTSRRSLSLLVGFAILFAGCSQKSAVSYTSVSELGDALQAEDVACDPADAENSSAELVKEQGACEIDGAQLEIFLFDDAKQRDGWLEFGGRLRPATAFGPNWALIGATEVVATAADALGGELKE